MSTTRDAVAWPRRPLWHPAVGIAVTVVASLLGVVIAWRLGAPTWRDSQQFLGPLNDLRSGDLKGVYTDNRYVTSPPLYLYLLALFTWAFDGLLGPWGAAQPPEWLCHGPVQAVLCHGSPYPLGFLMLVACIAAVGVTLWMFGYGPRTPAFVLGVLAAAGNVALIGCVAEYWHPQDLLGAALSLLAVALVVKRRITLAGVCFGLALLTRQTALLPLIVMFALVPPAGRGGYPRAARWKLAGLAGAVALIGTLPFLVASPSEFVSQMAAPDLWRSPSTLVGRLDDQGAWIVGRLMPVVAVLVASIWLWRRSHRVVPSLDLVLGAALFASSIRLLAEPAPYSYYLAPAALLAIVYEARRGFPFVATLVAVGGFLASQGDWSTRMKQGTAVLSPNMVGLTWYLCGMALVALAAWAMWRGSREPEVKDAEPGPDLELGPADNTPGDAFRDAPDADDLVASPPG